MTKDAKSPKSDKTPNSGDSDYYEPYAGHARNLRLWFLAYGVGGPALLVSNDKVWERFSASPQASLIALLFFSGVALQIATVIIFKATMWILYMNEIGEGVPETTVHRASKFSCRYWPDLVTEVVTLLLFASATVLLIRALLP